ncbi:MAG: phosphoribosyltransferase family protein [bacterium]|nr:phosphoribosyltransferase family protein [bacterium]
MNEVLEILKRVGAVVEGGHYIGVSGSHFGTYMNKDALYMHTEEVSKVCGIIAEKYAGEGIEIVAAPATGGIVLSQWTAHHLSSVEGREVLSIYTEKNKEGVQVLKRGYDVVAQGKRVLVLEDNVSTGNSVLQTIQAIKAAGADVVGVCALVNRDPKEVNTAKLGAPLNSLVEYPVEMYPKEDCPLCQKGVAININLGHGSLF